MQRRNRLLTTLLAGTLLVSACSSAQPTDEEPNALVDASSVSASTITTAETSLGTVLVDSNGLTLYGFTDDTAGVSTCYDDCAAAWPPVAGDAAADALVSASVSSIDRDDGTTQLAITNNGTTIPLYTFVGDGGPGDVNGQGSGDVWFAVRADGSLVTGDEAAAPAAEEAAAPVAAVADGDLGPVLTNAAGQTLYTFANDANGTSVCNDPCSTTWPPVAASEVIDADALRLTSVTRDDGSTQLALDGQALYTYAGDAAPGEVNGHLVGGVWFASAADGTPIIPSGARVGSTDAGDVLIDAEGFTIYQFANDQIGVSNCADPCSATWPAVSGDTAIDIRQLDATQFGTITRDDGSIQLTFDGWPLYNYIGDEFPGDANGVNIGDGVWSALNADRANAGDASAAAPISIASAPAPAADAEPASSGGGYSYGDDDEAAPAAVAGVSVGATDIGDVLVDAQGRTLYAFLNDTEGTSNCNGACADAWPPTAGDSAINTDDLDAATFSTIAREDGSSQLAIGKWALYTFAGDSGPGDLNGQGSGDAWFAVNPDGSLNK